ncbi:hypothetical protein L2E82_47716 [Cichorium intybus]|uniref:Uncharacterized protein n=1 Tax=Cichorium intybus TaxID=13427 RepID=A0ACB8YWI6_CICIN|nr:hypothetical protein L2E82_47716 [Cichorium intybus]
MLMRMRYVIALDIVSPMIFHQIQIEAFEFDSLPPHPILHGEDEVRYVITHARTSLSLSLSKTHTHTHTSELGASTCSSNRWFCSVEFRVYNLHWRKNWEHRRGEKSCICMCA